MKKLFFGLLLCLILSMNCFSEEHTYKNIKPKIYNDVYKKQFDAHGWLTYEREKDMVIIYFKDYLATVAYDLDEKDRVKIIETIDKYEEWNDKAVQKKVTLEKTIDEIKLKGAFMIGEWYFAKKALVSFVFFSQDINSHQLVLDFEKLRSWSNEFITHKPQTLYFDYTDAIEFRDALKEENIKKVLEDISKKEEIEDEFK